MASIEELIDRALDIIINARRDLIDKDEALDASGNFSLILIMRLGLGA